MLVVASSSSSGGGSRSSVVARFNRSSTVLAATRKSSGPCFTPPSPEGRYIGSTSAMLAALQERLDTPHSLVYSRFEHHVTIENYVDPPCVVEGDIIPLRQRYLAAVLIGAPPAPHPQERNGAQAAAHKGIALLEALRNKERHSGITEHLPREGVDVEDHAGARGCLVLDRLAVLADAWLVGPELVGGYLAGGRVDGN